MIDESKNAPRFYTLKHGDRFVIFTLVCTTIVSSYFDIGGNETWPDYKPKRTAKSCTKAPMTASVCDIMNVFLPDNNAKTSDMCSRVANGIKQNPPSGVTITVLSIMIVCLLISCAISLYDVINDPANPFFKTPAPSSPEDLRRFSLSEFAKARHQSRKESSVDVSDSIGPQNRSVAGRAASLCRYESVGSAFTRMRRDSVAPGAANPMTTAGLPTGTDTPSTPPVGPSRANLKLFGGRPAPLLRRSSFPASALVDGADRRGSVDSEDDSSPDVGKRRVRIIRRH